MRFHIFAFLVLALFSGSAVNSAAQVDAVIGQVSSSFSESFAGGISGDGRFIVFESTGNLATLNPDNADGNREIFLFDYAQRRIFQITRTKSLLTDRTLAPTSDNVKVEIVNLRPVISNDGKWIAFSSNATCAYPGNGTNPPIVSTTNPSSFDPNATTANPCLVGTGTSQINNLVNDGNTELWFYEVCPTGSCTLTSANLSAGDELPLTDLSLGVFTRVTNTLPSRLPVPGSTTLSPVVADDNHDASIDDTGSAVSFTSNRDLVPCATAPTATCGNAAPSFDNDEIYFFPRGGAVTQISATTRGSIGNPIYNANSTISNLTAGGWRIAFIGNGNNPIIGMTGSNADINEEIFYADVTAAGALGTNRVQVTTTTRTAQGDVVNVLTYGRRMSRDGRYIAFDSFADLANEHSGTNQTQFGSFVFDTTLTTNATRRILPRSAADSGANGGDIQRYIGFSDYDANRAPQTLVMQTRMNIKADGTIPSVATEGLNNNASRPAQVYSLPLTVIPASATFKRLTTLPTPLFFLASIQPIPSNTTARMTFNLAQTEFGTGNFDLASEVYYYLLPVAETTSAATFNFSTGASRMAVSPSPVPTPTATPTPSPTPTPTTTPSPTPTPTPQQPAAVRGVSPGMLAVLDFSSGLSAPVVARTAVGSIERRFTLPIELSGVTMTINGAACGIKAVGRRQITFVVPPGLTVTNDGNVYPVVINNNGVVIKGNVTVMPARPDIFTNLPTPQPGGRARIFNATNRVLLTEPFPVRTFRLRGSKLVSTVLRVYVTGVQGLGASDFSIRIGSRDISGALVVSGATLVEPGVYTIDFSLPFELAGAGDQPIIITAVLNGVIYQSRLDDTAARLFIL